MFANEIDTENHKPKSEKAVPIKTNIHTKCHTINLMGNKANERDAHMKTKLTKKKCKLTDTKANRNLKKI